MSQVGVVLLAVSLTVGCVGPDQQRMASGPFEAVHHLDVTGGPAEQQQLHGEADRSAPDPVGSEELVAADDTATRSTPAAAAAAEVVRLLALEGLFVYDLRSEVQSSDETATVVEVRVVSGTGRGHPTSPTSRVGLRLDGRQWTVTSIEERR